MTYIGSHRVYGRFEIWLYKNLERYYMYLSFYKGSLIKMMLSLFIDTYSIFFYY
jgi:hypothetical protein